MIELLALIIATLAFFVALWQVITGRKHNKLSVKPLLVDWLHYDVPEEYLEFTISNKGLGTAKILKFECFENTKLVDMERIETHLREITNSEVIIDTAEFSKASALSKDESKVIIKLWYLPNSRLPKDAKRKSLNLAGKFLTEHCKLVITYESMYEEKFRYESEPLPWYD